MRRKDLMALRLMTGPPKPGPGQAALPPALPVNEEKQIGAEPAQHDAGVADDRNDPFRGKGGKA